MPVADLPRLQHRFAQFAATYPELSLYAAICRAVADDPECAAVLSSARPGQDRPVLWLAALHDLVLATPSLPAARWYASVVGRDRVPAGDPWPDVRETVLAHADTLRGTIATRTTQTNEINRCVYLAPALAAVAADLPGHPLVLVELGASAGLLLHVDRYRVDLEGDGTATVLGDGTSSVRCQGRDRSDAPYATRGLPVPPPVVGRAGVDLHPVDLHDDSRVRWLEACLWPDVPGRVERFRAAVDLVSDRPAPVVAGDMVGALPAAVAAADAHTGGDAHLVVFSSWALTYLDRSRRPEVLARLVELAGSGRPVSWVTAEPPGCVPGLPDTPPTPGQDTVLGLHRWRDGTLLPAQRIGSCHPHGEWVRLD